MKFFVVRAPTGIEKSHEMDARRTRTNEHLGLVVIWANSMLSWTYSVGRNVLKATIEAPELGEINIYCTHLDHLDENWRMKQINAIIQSTESPHILAGGLNSLDETDYSPERWSDIVKARKLQLLK